LVQSRFAHETPIVAIAISADGKRLGSAAEDRSVKAWTLPDLEQLGQLPRAGDIVAAIVPAGDGFLLGRMDGVIDRVVVPATATAIPGTAVALPAEAEPDAEPAGVPEEPPH
ncbi:MAG: hypothetical protein ACK6CT_00005, partial [Planctomycetia bacterium]